MTGVFGKMFVWRSYSFEKGRRYQRVLYPESRSRDMAVNVGLCTVVKRTGGL